MRRLARPPRGYEWRSDFHVNRFIATLSRRSNLRLMMSAEDKDMLLVHSVDELHGLLGSPTERAVDKERSRLHAIDRAWLAASPFCLVASSDAEGNCDVSPKGDPPGFVHVVDDQMLAIPERPGNRRADGFQNVLSNPHVGLISFVPGRRDTLRINGRARIARDAPFFDAMTVKGHRPSLALVVDIEQVFFHCAKAFLRSALWDVDSWQPEALPSHAEIVKAVQKTEMTLEELEAHYGPSYQTKLYE
jgi:PPOX class probable FMN-dependent enzyme